jgi:type I restriction-modification system DNA methylase subunit
MINFLESWEKYLLARLEKIKIVEDIGYLYEEFVSQDEAIRKAGGVYYTPQYIVNEIVKQTIGKKIAGKTPKEIEDLSILDPSCGSGSFLLGAYQFLFQCECHF